MVFKKYSHQENSDNKMPRLCKRSLPQFLLDYKKDLDKNQDHVPSAGKKYVKAVEERLLKEIDNFIKQANNIGSKENSIIRKTEELMNKKEEVKLLDKELSNLKKTNTDLEVTIKAVKKNTENIEDEIPKLEETIVTLEEEATSVKAALLQRKEDIKMHYNSLLKILHTYKKYTGCNVRLESSNTVIFEFNPDFYVKLHSEDLKTNWSLLAIKPELNKQDELERKLIETDDVQGLLSCVYNTFSSLLS